MASFARASMGRSFSGGINVVFIRSRSYFFREQLAPPPTPHRHAILTFLVPQLLKFLQLQFQGQVASPFQTHPKTMFVAITSLLTYCFAYDAELRSSSTDYAHVISRGMAVTGWLCSVTLASILFPDSVRLVLYLLYTLFLASELVHSQLLMLWNWLHQTVMGNFLQERGMRQASINRRWFIITPASANRGGLLPL